MPRVSDEHRAQRREQILDAARHCFIRDGFHQTSMVDIFAEAGLSAGAVYGYFKGKNEIIVAIAEDVMGRITATLEPILTQDPPPTLDEALRSGLTQVENFAFGEDGFGRLAPQVWSEATRNPALAGLIQERYSAITDSLTALVATHQRHGLIGSDADPQEVVAVVFGAHLGYIVQRLLYRTVTPDSYANGLAALTHPTVTS